MHVGSVYLSICVGVGSLRHTRSCLSLSTAKALLSSTSIECGRQGSKRGEGRFHLIYQLQGRPYSKYRATVSLLVNI
jgi:hypothetical protein